MRVTDHARNQLKLEPACRLVLRRDHDTRGRVTVADDPRHHAMHDQVESFTSDALTDVALQIVPGERQFAGEKRIRR